MDKYKGRLDNLMLRRVVKDNSNSEFSALENILLESLTKSEDKDIVKYINEACNEVNEAYTRNTLNEGERVQNQLDKVLTNISYQYQGSVSNNTHIKANSDLDLLVLLESGVNNSLEEITDLKNSCEEKLTSAFPEVSVTRGAKTLKLEGGSLKREIDVIPSHWERKAYCNKKGVCVLDEKERRIHINTPFYHNELLLNKDNKSKGYYKKAIRLLKNVKYEIGDTGGTELKISSYEIVAILYFINFESGTFKSNLDLIPYLIKSLNEFLVRKDLLELRVPDESRIIIKNRDILEDLRLIIEDLKEIESELVQTKFSGVAFAPLVSTPKAWGK